MSSDGLVKNLVPVLSISGFMNFQQLRLCKLYYVYALCENLMVALKKNLRMTEAALRENAIHECGHAVIAARLGVIAPNGRTKMWAGGRGRHGIGMNTWFGAVDFCSGERELLLIALLAGQAAQFKSLPRFAEKGWNSDAATVWAGAKGPQSQYDREEIQRLLRGYSDDVGKQLQFLIHCTEKAHSLVDRFWSVILKAARALLKTGHFSLPNKQVIKMIAAPNERTPNISAADRRHHPRSTQTGAVRARSTVPATICAIADSIRWAEQIMDEIDRRWPANRHSTSMSVLTP